MRAKLKKTEQTIIATYINMFFPRIELPSFMVRYVWKRKPDMKSAFVRSIDQKIVCSFIFSPFV